jgi:hypothetical protein
MKTRRVMLDVLNKHLHANENKGCVVEDWIKQLDSKEQDAFAEIKKNNHEVKIAQLYKDLSTQLELPFKLTAFRSHLRGYCTCL